MSRFNYPPNAGQNPDQGSPEDFESRDMDEIPLSGDDLFMAQSDIDEANDIREEARSPIGDDLHDQLAQKENELAEMNDRFLRLAAEMENMRRRAEREKQDAGRYAITELARDLVNVADNFDRALRTVPQDTKDITHDMVDSLVTGLRLTEKELLTLLQRYNVNRIFPEGERFDPNLHQAVAQVPGNGVPAGHVVDVAQPGFTIGERVLRAAMVTISLGDTGGDKPAPEETDDPESNGTAGDNLDTSA